jgi:hypothetical protein
MDSDRYDRLRCAESTETAVGWIDGCAADGRSCWIDRIESTEPFRSTEPDRLISIDRIDRHVSSDPDPPMADGGCGSTDGRINRSRSIEAVDPPIPIDRVPMTIPIDRLPDDDADRRCRSADSDPPKQTNGSGARGWARPDPPTSL